MGDRIVWFLTTALEEDSCHPTGWLNQWSSLSNPTELNRQWGLYLEARERSSSSVHIPSSFGFCDLIEWSLEQFCFGTLVARDEAIWGVLEIMKGFSWHEISIPTMQINWLWNLNKFASSWYTLNNLSLWSVISEQPRNNCLFFLENGTWWSSPLKIDGTCQTSFSEISFLSLTTSLGLCTEMMNLSWEKVYFWSAYLTLT